MATNADSIPPVKAEHARDSAAQTARLSTIDSTKRLMEEKLSKKSREELYRELFKTAAPPLPKKINASITINNEIGSVVEISFSDDRNDFFMPAQPVITKLTEIAVPEVVQKVKAQVDQNGRISRSDLTGLGLNTVFDSKEYKVRIAVPSVALLKQVHALIGEPENPYSVASTRPDPFSAYVNIQASQQLKYRQIVSNTASHIDSLIAESLNKNLRQPFFSNFDGALNARDVVLEGAALYQENAARPLLRQDVRLVYDRPKSALRFSAGDMQFSPLDYYQSGIRMGGIGISKDYSLQPNVLTYPVGDYEFYLADPAEVEVWVDEVMVKRMALEAGTHDIRAFPFSTGNNRVTIFVRDYAGRCDTVQFSFLHQSSLLAEGKSQYSYMAGFPNQVSGNNYTYLTDKPFVSLAYRRGFTNRLTCDLSSQAFFSDTLQKPSLHLGMLGLGGRYAIPSGLLELNMTGSYVDDIGPDLAARLAYTYQTQVSYKNAGKTRTAVTSLNTPFSCRTQVEYLGENFSQNPYNMLVHSIDIARFSSDINIPLGDRLTINFGGMYFIRRDTANLTTLYLRFRKNFLSRLSTSLTFQYTSGDYGHYANPAIMASAQWAFRSGSHDFSVSEDISKHQPEATQPGSATGRSLKSEWDFNTGFQWLYDNADPRPEKLLASAAGQIGPYANDYTARLGYTGNQGSVEVGQILYEPQDSASRGKYLQHQTNMSLKTALVYTDNTVCFSRPVYNGFAIVKGVKDLAHAKIMVNPSDQGYEATTTMFGPAVLPLYAPYQLKRLRLAPLNVTMGTENQNLKPVLFPQYKSGFLITLGSERNVVVFGTLMGTDGQPFAYKTITITPRDNKKTEPTNTFTNSIGRFQFLGAAGASFEISSTEPGAEEPITVEIPKKAKDVYELGTLRFAGKEKKSAAVETEPAAQTAAALPAAEKKPDSSAMHPAAEKKPDTAALKKAVEKEQAEAEIKAFKRAFDSSLAMPESAAAAQKKPSTEDSSTYVLGTLYKGDIALAHTFIAVLALEDLSAKWITSFTDKYGGFQVICPRPGRYKIMAARSGSRTGIIFTSANFTIPVDKKGYFCHLDKVVLPETSAPGGALSFAREVVRKQAGIPQKKAADTALLSACIYVSGTLAGPNNEDLGYTLLTVTSPDDPQSAPVNTFTKKDGSFQFICYAPGRYRITQTNIAAGPSATFVVPAQAKGVVDVRTIKLAR